MKGKSRQPERDRSEAHTAKRPRIQGPEGFQKPKSSYKPPESIKKFVSAFDTPTESSSSKAEERQLTKVTSKDRISAKPVSKGQASLKPISRTRHGPPPDPCTESASSSEVTHGIDPSTAKRPLKPPMFTHPPRPPQPDQKSVPSTSGMAALKLAPKFQMLTDSEDPTSTIRKPPPMPLASTSKSTTSLKPLALPPLPDHRPTSPQKNMTTILTTSVAHATDPTKEGGGAEILSLFLQQHGHNFTSHTDRELQRGVMVSPDKRGRGKEPKFIRGGLAERAQHLMTCSRTDFALWRRQMEQKIESITRVSADLHLRILKVLHITLSPDRPRTIPVPRSGLALCRLRSRHKGLNDLPDGTYVTLFSFSSPAYGGRTVSTADGLEEGREVLAWMPWHKVVLTADAGGVVSPQFLEALDALNPPRCLLFCSRYHIVAPKPGS
ncbi:hypothetical protein BV22DRAFT_1066783 [Leucogyrophana mollusca]|uniref:Uncharacterized protein n=1 Tax=Leucogyrophana mollusca TaxID=85980 RepID=A0ACB8BG29_9AGAM|nr:hypothetical protein BV22DRAFT_1066783 [Leucogyrophana mollusca]